MSRGDRRPRDPSAGHVYLFGDYRLDTRRRELTRHGEPVPLSGKPFDLLVELLASEGNALSHEELYRVLWPGVTVLPANLKQQIWTLRQALGGEAEGSKYLVTVRGVGYRIGAAVSVEADTTPAAEEAAPEQAGGREAAWSSVRRKRFWFASLAVLAMGIIGLAVARPYLRRAAPRKAVWAGGSSHSRPAIAVLGFKDLSRDPEREWLSVALSDMLSTELGAGGRFRVIAGEAVERAKADLSISEMRTMSPETLARLRRALNVDLVLVGSHLRTGDAVRMDITVQDATTADSVAAMTQSGSESDLLGMVSRAGETLRSELGVKALALSASSDPLSEFPHSTEATRLYSEGLASLRRFEERDAKGLFERAADIEPDSAVIQSALSEALLRMGYKAKATEAAKRARDLSRKMPEEVVLLAEGRYFLAQEMRQEAVQSFTALRKLFPDDIDYGLGLVSACEGNDALGKIEELRNLPSPAGADPRLDLEEARAACEIGDYRRALDASRRAVEAGARISSRLLQARARLAEGKARTGLGERADAMAAFEAARAAFTEAGDVANAAWTTYEEAAALADVSRYDEALERMKEAQLSFRRIGNRLGAAAALTGAARALTEMGDYAAALRRYEIAVGYFEEIGDRRHAASMRANIAIMLTADGKLTAAASTFERSAAELQELGFRENAANTLTNAGMLYVRQGKLGEAETSARSADALVSADNAFVRPPLTELMADIAFMRGDLGGSERLCRALSEQAKKWDRKVRDGQARFYLARAIAERGDLAVSRRMTEEALAIFEQIGQSSLQAKCWIVLSRGDCARGHATGAAAMAARAAETLGASGEKGDEIEALSVLASCQADAGDLAGAHATAEKAWQMAAGGEDAQVRMKIAPVVGLILAASGEHRTAMEIAGAGQDEAVRLGYVPLRLDAALALGRIEMRSGASARARRRLEALAVEAGRLGFKRIEAEAREVFTAGR